MGTAHPIHLEPLMDKGHPAFEIGLTAGIASVEADNPQILVMRPPSGQSRFDALPYGPYAPVEHKTLEAGLRSWVVEQTGLTLGYVEQLYTFGNRGHLPSPHEGRPHVISIGYVALTRIPEPGVQTGGVWCDWYDYFPWEDWRHGKPKILDEVIEPRLREWAARPQAHARNPRPMRPSDRLRICFGLDGVEWDEEKVLERYELLFEAGLVPEDGDGANRRGAGEWTGEEMLGRPMLYDHRRILATSMSRLRGKIKYRPLIFEVMTEAFTLFELQRTVEAILGSRLHKQNFRRLVENGGLVEPTGEVRTNTGGRPAKLFRFRRSVLLERPAPGVRVHALTTK